MTQTTRQELGQSLQKHQAEYAAMKHDYEKSLARKLAIIRYLEASIKHMSKQEAQGVREPRDWEFCPWCKASRTVIRRGPSYAWLECGHELALQPDIEDTLEELRKWDEEHGKGSIDE